MCFSRPFWLTVLSHLSQYYLRWQKCQLDLFVSKVKIASIWWNIFFFNGSCIILYYLITNHIHVACLHENGYVLVNCKGDATCEVSARSRDISICKQTCSTCNTCLNYPFKVLWFFNQYFMIYFFSFLGLHIGSPSGLEIVLSCVVFFLSRIRR